MEQLVIGHKNISFQQAKELKAESMWKNLADITVEHAMIEWLKTMNKLTSKNYTSGIRKLVEHSLIDMYQSLQCFALVKHNDVIDRIKLLTGLSECSKQARAACYISFTRFLNRKTEGIIPRAIPSREGTGQKTFFKVREKVTTQAMNRMQWSYFLSALNDINARDCLIAKIILQGGKRVSEVLTLTTDKIDYAKSEITFKQSKTKGYEKETVITYPDSILNELKSYINNREGLVFVTKNSKPVLPNQLAITFNKAGVLAGIPFKVTPHVLRASAITYLKREGFPDSEIQKVTGHGSAAMVHAYDKSERSQNPSKKISLI